jgi:hypothetical protein
VHILDLARATVATVDSIDVSGFKALGHLHSLAAGDQRIAVGLEPASVVTARLDAVGDPAHAANLAFTWPADTIDGLALSGDVVLAVTGSEFAHGSRSSNELLCFRLSDAGHATQLGEALTYDSYGRALTLAPDGRSLVLGTGNGNLYRCSFDPTRGCALLAGPPTFCGQGAHSPELGTTQRLSHSGEVRGIAFLDATTFLAVSVGSPDDLTRIPAELRCWSVDGQEMLLERLDGREPAVRRRPRPLCSVAVALRRGLVLVGTTSGELEVWSIPAR